MMRDEPKITEAFKTERGVGWHEHDAALFSGTERFFRPGYGVHLLDEWLPALDGVAAKLERGAQRSRCRLRPWRHDDSDGKAVSALKLHRL